MSQGAISSLVFSSGTVVTAAASMGHAFGRPTTSKKHRKSIQLSLTSIDISFINNNSSTLSSSSTVTNVSPKSPLKRFKLFRSFRSKNKRSKISSSTYIVPPKTTSPHVADDDVSSICSDVFNVKDRDRKTLSAPNLSSMLHQSKQDWNNSSSFILNSVSEILHEEDEEDEDWDTQSGSGYNEIVSKVAGTSSPSLPIPPSTPPKRHSRCKSLPPPNLQDFSPSLFHRQPTPSEIWDGDEDFDLDDTNELNVPLSVEEAQVSLRMDISNIRDFVTHIGELKVLRDKKVTLSSTIQSKMTRKWKNGFLRTTSKKMKHLESMFKQDWEEAIVIIDIADVAQNNETTFGEEKRVEVDIERIPSERHMRIFKKIVAEGLGDDARDLALFDDDKENHAKKQRLMSFCMKHDDDDYDYKTSRRRRENVRMSVEVMPSLVDHLRKLQSRLNNHVKELEKLAQDLI